MNKFTNLLSLLLLCVNQGKTQFQLGFMTERPTPSTFDPDCKDQLDNCYSFSKEYCRAPYEKWAKDYCANTCGFCIGPTTPALPCNDNITNCERYGTSVCTDLNYRPWANKNCRYTCRLCVDGFIYTTTTLAPEKCVDKVDCRRFGTTACSEQFKEWSHENCRAYCSYCQGIPTPPPACVDKIPNCQAYEKTVCTSPTYQQWAEDNCRKYCGVCTVQPAISFVATPPMPGRRDGPSGSNNPNRRLFPSDVAAADYPVPTLPPDQCFDTVECRKFINACEPSYHAWAKYHCPLFCGLCQGIPSPPVPCTDKLSNCHEYQADACTAKSYKFWAEDNCRKFCGLCDPDTSHISTTMRYLIPPPLGKRVNETRAPLKKRQFSASHHHNGVHLHECWDQNTGQVRTDDPSCLTAAPSTDVSPAATTHASATTAAFPGSEFDPHPTPPEGWDSKDSFTEKKSTTTQKESTKPEPETTATTAAQSVKTVTKLPVTSTSTPTSLLETTPGMTTQIANVIVTQNGTQSAGGSTLAHVSSLTTLPGDTGSCVLPVEQTVTQPHDQSIPGSTPTIITILGNATTSSSGGGTGTVTSSTGQTGGLTNVTAAITTKGGASNQPTAPAVGGSTTTHIINLSPGPQGSVTNTTGPSQIFTTWPSEAHSTQASSPSSSSTSHATPIMTPNTQLTTPNTPATTSSSTSTSTTPVATPSKLTTTPTTTESPTTVEACKDRLENCRNYPVDTACHGIYEAWARFNCPDHCGFCPKSTTLKPCVDKLPNCKEYDSGDLCTSPTYRLWAEDNCFAYCRLGHCGGKSGNIMMTTMPTTTPTTTTTEDPNCRDVSDRCVTITDHQCFGIYEAWARSQCAYRCGFCNTTCYDKNQNCDKYESEICTAQSYQGWARTNCRKFCNMCDPPTPPPTEFGKTRSTVTQQTPGHMTSQIPTFTVPTVKNH